MKKILIALSLLVASGFAMADSSGVANGTGTGTGTASSGLNYAPVSNYVSPDPKPNTVIAPSINPTVVCANTGSGGLAFGGLQIVGGGSHVDQDCATKELIKMTFAMGDPMSAFDMECEAFATYRASRLRQGKPCIQDTDEYKAKQQSALSPVPYASAKVNGIDYTGNDPVVIERLKNQQASK